MSGRTWVCADHHFGHKNILTFTKEDGSKLRDFQDVHHMHKVITERHNAVVADEDRVYFLGDVAINRRSLECLNYLKGRKVLVKGNHDIFKLKDYLPYFDDIRSCVVGGKPGGRYILSHIPIHPGSLGRFERNIHGHLHSNVVKVGDTQVPDKRYICVSLENIGFAPVDLDDLIKDKYYNV